MATVEIARAAERDLEELIAIYSFEEARDRVTVVAFQDARSAGAAIQNR